MLDAFAYDISIGIHSVIVIEVTFLRRNGAIANMHARSHNLLASSKIASTPIEDIIVDPHLHNIGRRSYHVLILSFCQCWEHKGSEHHALIRRIIKRFPRDWSGVKELLGSSLFL